MTDGAPQAATAEINAEIIPIPTDLMRSIENAPIDARPDLRLVTAEPEQTAREWKLEDIKVKDLRTSVAVKDEDSILTQYLGEIGQFRKLEIGEQRELRQNMREGEEPIAKMVNDGLRGAFGLPPAFNAAEKDPKVICAALTAKQIFIHANLKLVVSEAKNYQGHGVSLLDLVQSGYMGLNRAIDKFDERKGFAFSTYATRWLKKTMQETIRTTAPRVHIPPAVQQDMLTVEKEIDMYYDEHGPDAPPMDDKMLLEATGWKPNRLALVRSGQAMEEVLSLQDEVPSSNSSATEAELQDFVIDPNSSVGYERAEDSYMGRGLFEILGTIISADQLRVLAVAFELDGKETSENQKAAALGVTVNIFRARRDGVVSRLRHPSVLSQLTGLADLIGVYDTDWVSDAACAGLDPKQFFKEKGESADMARMATAQNACDTCPVQQRCAEYATEVKAKSGQWGGVYISARAARKIRAKQS